MRECVRTGAAPCVRARALRLGSKAAELSTGRWSTGARPGARLRQARTVGAESGGCSAVRWAVRCDCGAQVARARPRLTWLLSAASQVAHCRRPPPSCRGTPPHALGSPLGFVIVQSLARSAFHTQRSRSVGLFSLCFEVRLFSHCIVYVRTRTRFRQPRTMKN